RGQRAVRDHRQGSEARTAFAPLIMRNSIHCMTAQEYRSRGRCCRGQPLCAPALINDQAQISRSDAFILGLDPPIRESGHLEGTPGLVIEGPAGSVTLTYGAICALRHIHMTPVDADVLGLKDQDRVEVAVESPDRRLIFGDVVVRVSSDYRLELHLDTDEGNAADLHPGADGMLLAPIEARARVLKRGVRRERGT